MKRVCIFLCLFLSLPARADFILSNAIVEFTSGGDLQQDVELISRSEEQDYIVTELYQIRQPGTDKEDRKLIDDPVEAGVLVTPDKTILPGGGRQVLRIVLLNPLGTQERIYRVTVKPVVNDVQTKSKMGLKILVGYEMLIIMRPTTIETGKYTLARQGRTLTVDNRGNSNVLLEVGKQCPTPQAPDAQCRQTPAMRVYAGEKGTLNLPFDAPVTYRAWDGVTNRSHDIP